MIGYIYRFAIGSQNYILAATILASRCVHLFQCWYLFARLFTDKSVDLGFQLRVCQKLVMY